MTVAIMYSSSSQAGSAGVEKLKWRSAPLALGLVTVMVLCLKHFVDQVSVWEGFASPV